MATLFKENANGKQTYRSRLRYTDSSGKRKEKNFYAETPGAADFKREEFKRKIENNIDPDCGELTVKEMVDRFIKYNSQFWEKATLHWYENMGKHVIRDIGTKKVASMRQKDFEQFLIDFSKYNPNTGLPPSKKTIKSVKQVLVATLNWAYANKMIEHNPAQSLKLPKAVSIEESCKRMKSRCLTLEEIGWIINTPHRLQTANMILLYTGMRPEELLALKWEDINIEGGFISITKALKYDNNTPYIGLTKTGNSVRKVIMPEELIDYLFPLATLHDPDDIVIPNNNGDYFHKKDWASKYASYIKDLDIKYGGKFTSKFNPNYVQTIKGWNPYSLRHTSATMGGFFGVDRKYLAENQGHEEVTMVKYYEEDLIDERRKQINKIGYKDFFNKSE